MKIVVLGPFHAGKSTFVKQFCGETAMSLDKMGRDGLATTVAMDFGVKEFEDIKLFVFGTPGMSHFSTIREILSNGADGIVFIIDAADPSKDKEVGEIWAEARKYVGNVPIVVLANKQDLPNSRSTTELRNTFEFLKKCKIIETSTKNKTHLDQAMHELLKRSLDKVLPLISKLNKYHGQMKSFDQLSNDLGVTKIELKKYLRFLEVRELIHVDYFLEMLWLSPTIKQIVDKLKQ
ncbi:MAG: GTP-binding protein [Candidatus Helarchaeota archaeon]|nr:GTP-binding protein [Candidatus Helarchaeota archaeon]